MIVNLMKQRAEILAIAEHWFDVITNLPGRTDLKERTGIQVLIREPGTRNLIFGSVREPSETAMFFAAEKAVRSYLFGHSTSQKSESIERMEFADSVGIMFGDGTELQASVSGLKAEEDTAVAVILLANILSQAPIAICKNIIGNGGKLPECFFDKNHYLYPVINGQ